MPASTEFDLTIPVWVFKPPNTRQKADHFNCTNSIAQARETKGLIPTHPYCIAFHHFKLGPNVGRKIRFVDDQYI